MPGSKSDYLENKLLDHALGNSAYVAPATLYFALYSAAPGDPGGGTEISGGGYARAAVTNSLANFPAAVGGSKSNGTPITWAQATASWGSVVGVGVFDAPTGGNLLYWSTITPKAVAVSDIISIPAGMMIVTED